MIHPWVVRQIEWFMAQQQPGSVTFSSSDGVNFKQVEFRVFKKPGERRHEQEEKSEEQAQPQVLSYKF